MPGFDGKNWLWRGDDLWYDRWQQVFSVQPDQIITWNDYGESHYIGPLRGGKATEAFVREKSPYNYALDMPHDGWRLFLPFLIDTYKNGNSPITREGLVTWYRINPKNAPCSTGGTMGNTLSQSQNEYPPSEIVQDKVFFSALLASSASISVTIGGVAQAATWENIPSGNMGLYHGSAPFNGATGQVVVRVFRTTTTVVQVLGKAITPSCTSDIQNWNAWVGSATASVAIAGATPPSIYESDQVRVSGFGLDNYAGLCSFACSYGYCPIGSCTCSKIGEQPKMPIALNVHGCPAPGLDGSYLGLCDMACNYNYCPSTCVVKPIGFMCEVSPTPEVIPPVFVEGTGVGNLAGLCGYTRNFETCPASTCRCTKVGPPIPLPAQVSDGGCPDKGLDLEQYLDLCILLLSRYVTLPAAPRVLCPARSYDNLEQIEMERLTITEECMDQYILQAEAKTLGTALNDYDKMLANGYDSKFKVYEKFIKSFIAPNIEALMGGDGRKYFTCTITTTARPCCPCQSAWHCPLGCERGSFCGKVQENPTPCPDYIADAGPWSEIPPLINYHLVDGDGFFKELEEKYAIEKSWITFGDRTVWIQANCGTAPVGTKCNRVWTGYPQGTDVKIPNPQDIMGKSRSDLGAFHDTLTGASMSNSMMYGGLGDVAEGAALPVFMMMEAVTSMQLVVDKADDIAEEEKKLTIILFLTSFLMLMPAVGGGITSLGFQAIGRAITSLGTLGEGAMLIYDIIDNPLNAIFLIFGLVRVRSKDFQVAAADFRALSKKDIDTLGPSVAGKVSKMSSLRYFATCRK